MSVDLRTVKHKTALDLLAELVQEGIEIPPEVQGAEKTLRTVIARRPSTIEQADLVAAYQTGATEAAIDKIAGQILTFPARNSAWLAAQARHGMAVLSTIAANGDDLTRQLAQLALPLIKELEAVAALPTTDVASLMRDQRTEDAARAARVDHTAGRLAQLYNLRRRVTKGAEYGIGGWDCSTWRRPDIIRAATAQSVMRPNQDAAERFLVGIRQGAGLWFPLPAEAEAAARPFALKSAKEAKAEKDRTWGVGSVAR